MAESRSPVGGAQVRATLRSGVTLNLAAFSPISCVMKRAVIGVPS